MVEMDKLKLEMTVYDLLNQKANELQSLDE